MEIDISMVPLQDPATLIEWLSYMYPERCPNPKDDRREIWMKAGERRAIISLIAKLENTMKKFKG